MLLTIILLALSVSIDSFGIGITYGLRKTSLSIFPEDILNEMLSELKTEDMTQFKLPELKTKITGPAVIVIPIAIYV